MPTQEAPGQARGGSPAFAELRDIFAGTDRGTVRTIADRTGDIQVGAMREVADRRAQVPGLETIRFASPTRNPTVVIGLVIDDPDTEAYRPLIGSRVTFRAKG